MTTGKHTNSRRPAMGRNYDAWKAAASLRPFNAPDSIPEPPAFLGNVPPPWEIPPAAVTRKPEAPVCDDNSPLNSLPAGRIPSQRDIERFQRGALVNMRPPVVPGSAYRESDYPFPIEMPTFGNFGIHLASETKATKVEWLWKGWLPLKSLAIMAAPPGVGKTTLAINLAATVTRGGPFPDGSRCAAGGVAHWSTEDNRYSVLQPHYEAENASLENVRYTGGETPGLALPPCARTQKTRTM